MGAPEPSVPDLPLTTRLGRAATKLLKAAIERQGFDVNRRRSDFHYAPDYYGRSFAQRADIRRTPVFGELASTTISEGRSCLYYDRLYVLYETLVNLARYASSTRPFRIVEVGVYKGGTSSYLASVAAALGIVGAELHSFDTFEGHADVDVNQTIDPVHKPGDFHDTSFEAVSEYLKAHANIKLYKGRFEDRCAALGDSPICMMHLDVDLYGPTLHALNFLDHRLVEGGVCIVDDYEVTSCPGVKAAVEEFLSTHPHYFAIHPMTEQCVLVKQSRVRGGGG